VRGGWVHGWSRQRSQLGAKAQRLGGGRAETRLRTEEACVHGRWSALPLPRPEAKKKPLRCDTGGAKSFGR
jgi:hypothetical protein